MKYAAVSLTDITGTVTSPATRTDLATPINGGPLSTLDQPTAVHCVPTRRSSDLYTIGYQICENLNPANCDTATITVTVDAAPIVANDDTYTGVNGAMGNANVDSEYTRPNASH